MESQGLHRLLDAATWWAQRSSGTCILCSAPSKNAENMNPCSLMATTVDDLLGYSVCLSCWRMYARRQIRGWNSHAEP